MKMFGVSLVLLGIVALLYGGMGYNRQSTILDVGGLKTTTTEHKTIPNAPVVGGIVLLGGLVVLMARTRRLG